MKNTNIKVLAQNAMLAAVYALFTVLISPIAYGGIQMRLSEILIFLAFYRSRYIPGLILGCLIANLFSPMGLPDVVFGTLATALACIAMYVLKNLYLAALAGSVINGIIVGLELHFVLNLPFLVNFAQVAVGELIVLVIGALIFQNIAPRIFRQVSD